MFSSTNGISSGSSFSPILSGSVLSYKSLTRKPLGEDEKELYSSNRSILGSGSIGLLRKIRTEALEENDPVVCQQLLHEAHQFCSKLAGIILEHALADKPIAIEKEFMQEFKRLSEKYKEQDAGSGYAIPPQYSIGNLFKATEDMLIRIQEKAGSYKHPDHILNKEELLYVLHEFLKGANDLSNNSIEKLFNADTKVGSILTGGSIFVEIIHKIIAKYAEPSLQFSSFVIAVDKHKGNIMCEEKAEDNETKSIILTDDVIAQGGTMLTALWQLGKWFPQATIYSGIGRDEAGGYKKRVEEKHSIHLSRLFEDYYDSIEENNIDEALKLFQEAENYAKEHAIQLKQGWYRGKERIEKKRHIDDQLQPLKTELGNTLTTTP